MAGRPRVPVELNRKKMSKEEREQRTKAERELAGARDKIVAPGNLNQASQEHFYRIVNLFEGTEVLCNKDVDIISSTAYALMMKDRIELMLETEFDVDNMGKLARLQDMYTKQFYKGMTELGLSPNTRSKIADIQKDNKEKEEDPLLKLLARRGQKGE